MPPVIDPGPCLEERNDNDDDDDGGGGGNGGLLTNVPKTIKHLPLSQRGARKSGTDAWMRKIPLLAPVWK